MVLCFSDSFHQTWKNSLIGSNWAQFLIARLSSTPRTIIHQMGKRVLSLQSRSWIGSTLNILNEYSFQIKLDIQIFGQHGGWHDKIFYVNIFVKRFIGATILRSGVVIKSSFGGGHKLKLWEGLMIAALTSIKFLMNWRIRRLSPKYRRWMQCESMSWSVCFVVNCMARTSSSPHHPSQAGCYQVPSLNTCTQSTLLPVVTSPALARPGLWPRGSLPPPALLFLFA